MMDKFLYTFRDLEIFYDTQMLTMGKPENNLIHAPGKQLMLELQGLRAKNPFSYEQKMTLELYRVGDERPLCQVTEEPCDGDLSLTCGGSAKPLEAGEYFLWIVGAEPETELLQQRFDEWRGGYRYRFTLLCDGESMEHPVLKKVSLSSDLKWVMEWDRMLTGMDYLDVVVYNDDWELMGKAENLCFRSSRLKVRLNSSFIWTDGKYFVVVSHNQQPFLCLNFDWKEGKAGACVWETIGHTSPCYILEKYLRRDTSWQKWQKVPGASAIRKQLAVNYVCHAFNLMRMRYGLPECWDGGRHCALVVENGEYDKELLRCFSELNNPSLSFSEEDCSVLLESRNDSSHISMINNVVSEWGRSVLCLHHLSALMSAGGSLMLRALEKRLQENKSCVLMLVGTSAEIDQVKEASVVIGKRMKEENVYRLDEYSLAEQVHWIQRRLMNGHFTLSAEAGKRLLEGLSERPEWKKEQLQEWMDNVMFQRFANRILMLGRKEEYQMREMLATIDAEDICFPEKESRKNIFADSVSELNRMVGLTELKSQMLALFNRSRFDMKRRSLGLPVAEKGGYHMVFTGNPGTGKTTVARMIGRVFYSLGILSKGGVIVSERSKLVGRYLGDTENNVQALLEQAKGNVLFIDEAYTLSDGNQTDKRDFGNRVIESLLTTLSQKNPDVVIILAGYEKEMNQMLETNPGMKGRFPYHFKFEDYDSKELMRIACNLLADSKFRLTAEAEKRMEEIIEEVVLHKDAYFHNARWVEQYIQDGVLTAMAERLSDLSLWTDDVERYQVVEVDDVENGYRNMKPQGNQLMVQKRRIGFVA